jgi:hypothetical protein
MSDAVVVQEQNRPTVNAITQGAGFYSSIAVATTAQKLNFLKVIGEASSLNDLATDAGKAGVELKIKDVILQEVAILNDETGEMQDAIRTTFILEDETAVYATSKGIAQSIKQVFNVLGTPDQWEDPLEVTATREKGRGGFFYLTLKF